MEQEFAEGIDSWETMMFLYNSALKEVNTKLEILNDEFVHIHNYNPIEYIKSRIKTPESIVKKLKKGGYESTIENMVTYVKDIAGIRIVCSFTSDIYRLAEMIGRQNDLTVISVKDYMKHPKASGYKSYHMIVSVPIFLSNKVEDTKVEIQIRTIAMDFWASLFLCPPESSPVFCAISVISSFIRSDFASLSILQRMSSSNCEVTTRPITCSSAVSSGSNSGFCGR